MVAGQDPWDGEYRQRGMLWGGNAPDLPPLGRSLRVLELGAGNGRTAAALARTGCAVTAIDISPHAALLCRKACPDPDTAILVADGRNVPFRNASFGCVFASHITGHLSQAGRSRLPGMKCGPSSPVLPACPWGSTAGSSGYAARSFPGPRSWRSSENPAGCNSRPVWSCHKPFVGGTNNLPPETCV
jgi:SAM-dependent methyltransferase